MSLADTSVLWSAILKVIMPLYDEKEPSTTEFQIEYSIWRGKTIVELNPSKESELRVTCRSTVRRNKWHVQFATFGVIKKKESLKEFGLAVDNDMWKMLCQQEHANWDLGFQRLKTIKNPYAWIIAQVPSDTDEEAWKTLLQRDGVVLLHYAGLAREEKEAYFARILKAGNQAGNLKKALCLI